MSKTTISTFEFLSKFDSEDKAREHFEKQRWPDGPFCPHCGLFDKAWRKKSKPGYFRCGHCLKDFTARINTVLHRSHIPYRKWYMAIYLMMTARKGVSSLQLAKELGITQKSSWFLLHRLREACGNKDSKLSGIVEIDETYLGGRERNRHASKKRRVGRGVAGKDIVLGMRERGGKTKAIHVKDTEATTLMASITAAVVPGGQIMTDDHRSYLGLRRFYEHRVVNHSAKQYVDGMAHTNGIESVWAVLKRGFVGTYHHFSTKHLQRYVDEFAFRLNEGNVRQKLLVRISALLANTPNKRLTYKQLTQNKVL